MYLEHYSGLLQTNYNDVTIDSNTLEMLPIDDQLTNLSSVSVSSELSSEKDDHDPYLQSTFVCTSARTFTEQETIQQSIFDPQSSQQHVDWPASGSPIIEFTTEGYICSAFPTLSAQGSADFLALRQRMVTIASYFKHLMLYHDQRFATHPQFK